MQSTMKHKIVTAVAVVLAITITWVVVMGILSLTTSGPFEKGEDAAAEAVPTQGFGPLNNEIQIVEVGETAVAEPLGEATPDP